MNKKIFEKYIKNLPKKAKVLDAGCGECGNSKYVHSIRKDLDIYGIDIDNSLRSKAPNFIKFSNMSITDLKYKDAAFDCILCFHVLEHVSEPKKAVANLSRVLKKTA